MLIKCNIPFLPIGGEQVATDNQTYVKVGKTYYQPVSQA
ncbi:DUF6515 family protein [Chitinophaga sp.]